MMRRLLILALLALPSLSHAGVTFGPVVAQEYRFTDDTLKSTGLLTVGAIKYEAIPEWVTLFAFYGLSNRQYGENGQVGGGGAEILKRDIVSAIILGGADVDAGWASLRYRENWFIGAGVAFHGIEFDLSGLLSDEDVRPGAEGHHLHALNPDPSFRASVPGRQP